MKGCVVRLFSMILGGLVGFATAVLVSNAYLPSLRAWEDVLTKYATSIPPIFPEIEEVGRSKALISSFGTLLIVCGFVVGYLMTPVMELGLAVLNRSAQRLLKGVTRQRFIAGSVGLLGGILVSFFLLNIPLFFYLSSLPKGPWNSEFVLVMLNALILLTFGYVGGFITTTIFYPLSSRETILSQYQVEVRPRLLDTSVIIDGRITEIVRSGFIPGLLIVPN